MSKLSLIAFLLLTSCVTVNQTKPSSDDENEYERKWTGPGWYWGVYINHENDYWDHYNYYHAQGNDFHGAPEGRGSNPGEGGGRGGHGGGGGGGHK